jgi:hypothetical protein
MAVIPYQVVTTPHDGSGTKLVRWVGLTGGDTGKPFVCAAWQDKSVQFLSMDGNGVTIEGTLVPNTEDDANYDTLNDPQGNALSAITSDKTENILEHVYAIRPKAGVSLTGGTIYVLLGSSR